jgi:3-phenylpropionate/trans-cinnamate dioxygenase ferredoxin subunit
VSGTRFITVARTGEIPQGSRRIVRVGDVPVAVFHLEDGFFAIEDVCTHDGGPVAEGELCDGVIECPRHGAQFDVRTGAVRRFPAMGPITSYAVRVEGDEIQLEWS